MQPDFKNSDKLLEILRRRLSKLEERAERKGYNAEPETLNEIEDIQKKIEEIEDKVRSVVPPLLPFLLDCSSQEFRVQEMLESYLPNSPRPIILIVHGDERQAQDMFAERLAAHLLPTQLGLNIQKDPLNSYTLKWLDSSLPLTAFERYLNRTLPPILQCPGSMSVADAIVRQRAPVFLHTHLLTEDWKKHGIDTIKQFLTYWNALPQFSIGTQVVVGVFVKYVGQLTSKYNRLVLRDFDEQRKLQEDGNHWQLWNFKQLHCAILPRLEGVTRSDAEYWARSSTELRAICTGPLDTIQNGIAQIYQDWKRENNLDDSGKEPLRIPMSVIGERLRNLLAECALKSSGGRFNELSILQRNTSP